MEIKITDYIPAIDELSQETLLDVRERLVAYLKTSEEFSDLDVRPNSVVGDLVISPIAHMLASLEVGMNRIMSDIDLANVSQGTIYNCDFVKQYLNNFGEGQVYEYPSTGVVQLTYSDPRTKLLDYGTKFIFAADGGDYIYELIDVDNNITLRSPFEKLDLNNPNEKKLVKVGENRFVVNVAVRGPAGVGVNADTVPSTDIPHSSLIGAKALGDFDRGTLPENVMELALKVQKTYYSSSLNNRSGAVSFLLQTFPELRGVSAVINGDIEMERNKANILGVQQGALDVFVKSRNRYLVTEQDIKMVFDNERDLWVGSVDVIEPMLWLDGIYRAGSTVKSEVLNTYGRSIDRATCPGLTGAYSKYERLGFEIKESVTADDITPENLVNNDKNSSQIINNVNIHLLGQFNGNSFNREFTRNMSLVFTEVFTDSVDGIQKLKAFLRDDDYTHITREVIFKPNTDRTTRSALDNPEALAEELNGIDIVIENTAGTFGGIMPTLVGTSAKLKVTGRGGYFTARYRYDPNYSLIDKTVSNKDVQPVNVSVLPRNFLTCYVYELHVDYKKKTAQNVDLIKAKEEIVNYVNNLTYPHTYEEYTIAEILLYYGAEGIHKVSQRGQFFKTLANRYLTGDSVFDSYTIENPYTTTLVPPDNTAGIGNRNVNFILDAENVTFNAIQL